MWPSASPNRRASRHRLLYGLNPLDIAAVLAAGLVAGIVNAIVGSGPLLTFPVLLPVGYVPPVSNVSNTVGLAFGHVSGVVGHRRELVGRG